MLHSLPKVILPVIYQWLPTQKFSLYWLLITVLDHNFYGPKHLVCLVLIHFDLQEEDNLSTKDTTVEFILSPMCPLIGGWLHSPLLHSVKEQTNWCMVMGIGYTILPLPGPWPHTNNNNILRKIYELVYNKNIHTISRLEFAQQRLHA